MMHRGKVNKRWMKMAREFSSVITPTVACIFSAYKSLVGQAHLFVVDCNLYLPMLI